MNSRELYTLRAWLIGIDNDLGHYHDEILAVGMKETSTEYHVKQALVELWNAVADLTRRIGFALEDELEDVK